jgi:hypothetical protein
MFQQSGYWFLPNNTPKPRLKDGFLIPLTLKALFRVVSIAGFIGSLSLCSGICSYPKSYKFLSARPKPSAAPSWFHI